MPEYYASRALYRRFLADPSGIIVHYGFTLTAQAVLKQTNDPAERSGAYADRARAAVLCESKVNSVEELEARVNALLDEHLIADPQDTPANTADRARFVGTWHVIAEQSQGQIMDTTDRDFSITFEAGRYRTVINDRVRQDGSYWLDARRSLHRIDWTTTVQGQPHRLLGIYEFRGEDLLISMGNRGEGRPTTFTPDDYDPVVHYTLRRIGAP